MIPPKIRDPRFILVRRGGTLADEDHRRLALWASSCAEHVLGLFEREWPGDGRPRGGIEAARAWARGEISVNDSKKWAWEANNSARAAGMGMVAAQVPAELRELVLEDQRNRNEICWNVFFAKDE